ncbi:MAG: hypothetical protein JJU02_09140 [Cryomorphaceae bacterium]|nr:hypothetical protein [Cryomorphaceae bacterium]
MNLYADIRAVRHGILVEPNGLYTPFVYPLGIPERFWDEVQRADPADGEAAQHSRAE